MTLGSGYTWTAFRHYEPSHARLVGFSKRTTSDNGYIHRAWPHYVLACAHEGDLFVWMILDTDYIYRASHQSVAACAVPGCPCQQTDGGRYYNGKKLCHRLALQECFGTSYWSGEIHDISDVHRGCSPEQTPQDKGDTQTVAVYCQSNPPFSLAIAVCSEESCLR